MKGRKGFLRCAQLAALAAAALLLFTAVLFAGQIAPYDPNAQLFDVLQPPGPGHIAGTDRLGRDLFSRILAGLQTSVLSALCLTAVTAAAGTLAGMAGGWAGGPADSLLMRIADICLAFPGLVLALAAAALLGGGLANAMLALAAVSWPKYARLSRSQTLVLKHADFIAAARLAGDSSLQILGRHVLPNLAGPVLVTAVLDTGTMMMELAALSFLGLGAVPPTAELGSMMSGGRSLLQTCPWVVLGPGIAMCLAAAVLNLLGDAARDVLDPKSRF